MQAQLAKLFCHIFALDGVKATKSLSVNSDSLVGCVINAAVLICNAETTGIGINRCKQCFDFAYTERHVGRCYRNLGYYYIEQKEYILAPALYLKSTGYDKESTIPQLQL